MAAPSLFFKRPYEHYWWNNAVRWRIWSALAVRRFVCVILLRFTCLLCPGPLSDAEAAEKLNILVMGEDADDYGTGSEITVVRRDTRVFKQALEAITAGLERQHFDVYDERAVISDTSRQDRTGRTEAELIDIARSVQRPPIDAIVMFTVYAGAKKLTYTTDIYVRATARIVDVKTGRKLGTFDINSPKSSKANISCERDCLIEVIAKDARMMGEELGSRVGQKLASIAAETKKAVPTANPTLADRAKAYTLLFKNFAQDEITVIEEYLVAFDGYKRHRSTTASAQEAGYWYDTDIDSARLNRYLRMMLERVGTEGKVTFSEIDRRFVIERNERSPAVTNANAD